MANDSLCAPLGILGDGLTTLETMRRTNPNIKETTHSEGQTFSKRYTENNKEIGLYLSSGITPYYRIGNRTCIAYQDNSTTSKTDNNEVLYCQDTAPNGDIVFQNPIGTYVMRESLADKNKKEDLFDSLARSEVNPETEKYREK
jgi:hypothetical protein